MFKKILCPIDFSDGAREALRVGCQLAVEGHAALVIVHVWNPPVMTMASPAPIPGDALEQMYADAEAMLAAAQATALAAGAHEVSTTMLEGAAWPLIVEAVRNDPEVDVVVMGTAGRTGLRHAVLGSVAEQVVRHARCAVLVVRPPVS